MFILPLGGLSEMGMNMMAFIHKGRAFILDCGAQFPEPNQLGLDLVLPDVEFFDEYKIKVEAVVFTHAHEDHVGSIPFLFDRLHQPRLYATEFCFGMFEERLRQHSNFEPEDFFQISADQDFEVMGFKFEPFRVTHSLVDCLGFSIQSPVGRILHTGDFKLDPDPVDGVHFDFERVKKFADEGVQLLMSDSTNAGLSDRSGSEGALLESLEKIVLNEKKGKVIVTLFSSNIQRLSTLIKVARKAKRKLALCGRSVSSNTELATRLGFLDVKSEDLIPPQHVEDYEPHEVMILATGTQAEARSALNRMAHSNHPDISIDPGDLVIFSSRSIPGNEKKISKLINQLYRIQAKVIDPNSEFVHVSGHARKEELKELIDLAKPRFFVPVHGEYQMLVQHANLCKENFPEVSCLVAENGDMMELHSQGLKRRGRVVWGKTHVDEFRNIVSENLIKERKALGMNGLVIASAVIRSKDHKILRGPDFLSYGLPTEIDFVALRSEGEELLRDLRGADVETLEEELRILTRRHYRRLLSIKPTVIPIVYET